VTNLVTSEPIPLSDAIARPARREYTERRQPDPLEGLITRPWQDWFSNLLRVISAVSTSVRSVSPSDQSASIGATDLAGGAINAGLYRITYYARITQAATVSSSLTVTFDWPDGGVVPTFSGAAITGNTTTTYQTGTLMVRASGAPIRYATTYASVGGTPMKYRLDVVLEAVGA